MNNELITVDEFEKMCESFDPNSPVFDYIKSVENLAWLTWPNTQNYTIWLLEKNPNFGKRNPKTGLTDGRQYIRGATRFVHFETRREYDRVRYAIEDMYQRLENGKELKKSGVRNMSSVVDDVKNPTGLVHTADEDDPKTAAGTVIEDRGQIVTNGQDFKA